MDKISGWKTLIFAAVIALTSFLASPELVAYVADNFPLVGGALATAVAVLRAITNGPIFNKDKTV